jgi:hypothetical protein
MLFVFAALSAGAYGYHGSISGLFAALAAYRFLIGLAKGTGIQTKNKPDDPSLPETLPSGSRDDA